MNDIFRSQVLGIWNYETGAQLSTVSKVQKDLYLIAEFCKDSVLLQVQEAKQNILASRRTIVGLQKLKEKNPWAMWVGAELNQTRVEMQQFEDVIAQHKFHASLAKWSHLADKVNTAFVSCKSNWSY